VWPQVTERSRSGAPFRAAPRRATPRWIPRLASDGEPARRGAARKRGYADASGASGAYAMLPGGL